MKASPWFLGGVVAAGLAGLVFVAVGFLRPGGMVFLEAAGGAGKPMLAEAKKRAEGIQTERKKSEQERKALPVLGGQESKHRVFVSARLVYLPGDPEPVRRLEGTMKSEDGIEAGWKMRYDFSLTDPKTKDDDSDQDGFTNLEEYQAGTDPTDKEKSPAKESKLRSRSGEPVAMAVSFPEKGGGIFTIRFQVGTKRAQFKGAPGALFGVMAGPDGVEVLGDEKQIEAARAKAKEAGRNSHVIPLKFVSYEKKMEMVKDAKAGGVETQVDNSVVVLERKDALEGVEKLFFSTPQRPQVLSWDVGEIRFFTPAAGGTEVGPFRVGEVFPYEGKKFAVVGREGRKIQLLNQSEAGQGAFWVPAEAGAPADADKP